jgi:hypothetical protein
MGIAETETKKSKKLKQFFQISVVMQFLRKVCEKS